MIFLYKHFVNLVGKMMTIWRVHLKTEPIKELNYADVLDFCKNNNIIGVGWSMIKGHTDEYAALHNEIELAFPGETKYITKTFKAINAIRLMQPGDLVWTRIGGDASQYYLCQVDNLLWKDRNVTDEHKNHDIGNFVSAKWVHVGTEDCVPGKVVNSFSVSRTAQRISDVEAITKHIWNSFSDNQQNRYEESKLTKIDFWNMIGSEELECLVLLYIQSKGYMIYSSTLKKSSAKFEVIMIANDGSHRCFPQVKRGTPLPTQEYIKVLGNSEDKIFLFSTSENYGTQTHPQIICLTKNELELFIDNNSIILPASIQYWVDMAGM